MSKLRRGARKTGIATAALVALAAAVAALVGSASAAPEAGPDKTVWYAKTEPSQTHSIGARAKYDQAQGLAAAKAAGKPVKLPKLKVGFIQIAGQVYSAQRLERGLVLAVKTIGWQFVRCDAQGDPAKMESCGQSLLNQGVKVLFADGIEPSFINGTLVRAKEKNVPVFICCGVVTPSPLAVNLAPNEARGARLLAAAAIKLLKTAKGTSKIAIWNYPAIWGTSRTKEFIKAVNAAGRIEIAHQADVDGLNVVDGTRAGVETQLTQTPDLKGIFFSYDAAAFGAAQALKAKMAGKTFPDAPCIFTFHADPPQADSVRKGEMCTLLDQAYDNFSWIVVDQAAELIARKKAPSKRADGGYGPNVSLAEQIIITPSNLPKPGFWVQPPTSAPTFFTAKWRAEFTK